MKKPLIQFISALCALALALVCYLVWYHLVADRSAAVAALAGQISDKTNAAHALDEARAALSGAASEAAAVSGYFVATGGVAPLIDSLEGIGRAAGASVNVLSVASGGGSLHPVLTLALTASGPFDAVMRTVGALEYAPYALSVSSLALTKGTSNSWQASLTLSVGAVPAAASSTPHS